MARDFNGSTDYINVGTDDSLNLAASDCTIIAWLTHDNPSATTNSFFMRGAASAGNGWRMGIRDNAGTIEWRFTNEWGAGGDDLDFADAGWQDATWVGLIMRWSDTNDRGDCTVFRGGVFTDLTAVTSVTGQIPNLASTTTVLGRNGSSSSGYWSGQIGPVWVFGSALTLGEAKAVLLGGRISKQPVAYWPVNGSSTEPDWSGNGNQGTPSGTTVVGNPPVSNFMGYDSVPYTVAAGGATPSRLTLLGVG